MDAILYGKRICGLMGITMAFTPMSVRAKNAGLPAPTIAEIEIARRVFVEREPRHLFYRVATELIDLSLRGATQVSLAEALAVLLQTWNKAHYQYRGFDQKHFREIEAVVSSNHVAMIKFRPRDISSFGKRRRRSCADSI